MKLITYHRISEMDTDRRPLGGNFADSLVKSERFEIRIELVYWGWSEVKG